MAFKAIETQEELDKIVQERVKREKESTANKYADYDDLKEQVGTLSEENATLKATLETVKTEKAEIEANSSKLSADLKSYETTNLKIKIALQNGIPYDMATRLIGDDEETITKDAKKMSELISGNQSTPPLKNTEAKGDDENASYLSLLQNLNLEGE